MLHWKTTVCCFILVSISLTSLADEKAVWDQCLKNGEQAQKALQQCRLYLTGWLGTRDPQSGLIPRNLKDSPFWNAQDSSADNYPFMVLSAALLDRHCFDTTMRDMLKAEIRLTNRVDQLPDDFLFATQKFRSEKIDLFHLLFGASEYIKDGLIPLTEWLGPSPWSERMKGMMDSVWKHAEVPTPYGAIPTDDHEVNGDQMQALSRLYWITKNNNYKDWAFRIADYFLLDHLPTKAKELRLRDHGCEVVSGLSEVYVMAFYVDQQRYASYKPAMHAMLDTILQKGANEDGMFFDVINPQTGERIRDHLSDNWGYTYNAFLTVSMLDKEPRYRDAVVKVLNHIQKYKSYDWESGSADGYADTIEGGLNLLNRIPVDSAFAWVEDSMRLMQAKQQANGIIEGWHGDGNFARTSIMYALWKSQGVTIEPWREDVALGAVQKDTKLYMTLSSQSPWQGKIRFDHPRYKEWMGMPLDYPRINQFQEWFTLSADQNVIMEIHGAKKELTGKELRDGYTVECNGKEPLRIWVEKKSIISD